MMVVEQTQGYKADKTKLIQSGFVPWSSTWMVIMERSTWKF